MTSERDTPLSEARLLDWLARHPQHLPENVSVGIGDDAAVLRPPGWQALSTDLLIEGVHFRPEWISPWLLGSKAARVNLSDLAAMGARPSGLLLGLGLPRERAAGWFEPLLEGLLECCRRFQCPLLGGDLSSAPCLTLSVTVLGDLEGAAGVSRTGGRAGDRIAVIGPLGESRRGLELLQHERFPALAAVDSEAALEALAEPARARLLRSHFLPHPQHEAGLWVRRQGIASAMIDVSDGLAADLGKLARASRVRAVLDAGALTGGGPESDLDIMLNGGEDYALLFTLNEEDRHRLGTGYPDELPPCREVGRLETGQPGVWLSQGGRRRLLDAEGYDHFS